MTMLTAKNTRFLWYFYFYSGRARKIAGLLTHHYQIPEIFFLWNLKKKISISHAIDVHLIAGLVYDPACIPPKKKTGADAILWPHMSSRLEL